MQWFYVRLGSFYIYTLRHQWMHQGQLGVHFYVQGHLELTKRHKRRAFVSRQERPPCKNSAHSFWSLSFNVLWKESSEYFESLSALIIFKASSSSCVFFVQCPLNCRKGRSGSSLCLSVSPTSTWRPSLPECFVPAMKRELSTPAW